MKSLHNVNRRGFITKLTFIGLASLARIIRLDNVPDAHAKQLVSPKYCNTQNSIGVLDTKCLVSAIKEYQEASLGSAYTREQRANLYYAVDTINPQTHQEYAFSVWCSNRRDIESRKWADEYVRRRSGQLSQCLDHPLFELADMCVPVTYRIPVYRESFFAFLARITTVSQSQKRAFLTNISFPSFKLFTVENTTPEKYLFVHMQKEWKEKTSYYDLEVLVNIIRELYPMNLPYAWCSTIVERAFNKQSQQTTNL